MSPLRHHPVRNSLLIGLAVSVLTLAGGAAVCTVHASKKGAELEAAISKAQAAINQHDETLRESLAAATGFENLTVTQAKTAAAIAGRRPGVEGGRLVLTLLAERRQKLLAARGVLFESASVVTKENAAAVATAATQYFAKLYTYTNSLNQAKHAYAAELNAPWGGAWLHLAGYPKISLNPVKARPVAPKANATPVVPAKATTANEVLTPRPSLPGH